MSETSSNYITALDAVRADVSQLGWYHEGGQAQLRTVLLDSVPLFNKLRHAAFEALAEWYEAQPRPEGVVGERVQAVISRDVGERRWEDFGVIAEVIRPADSHGGGLYRVTFDGDDAPTGGTWRGSSLVKAPELFEVVGSIEVTC